MLIVPSSYHRSDVLLRLSAFWICLASYGPGAGYQAERGAVYEFSRILNCELDPPGDHRRQLGQRALVQDGVCNAILTHMEEISALLPYLTGGEELEAGHTLFWRLGIGGRKTSRERRKTADWARIDLTKAPTTRPPVLGHHTVYHIISRCRLLFTVLSHENVPI